MDDWKFKILLAKEMKKRPIPNKAFGEYRKKLKVKFDDKKRTIFLSSTQKPVP